jgi:hypothetical protein
MVRLFPVAYVGVRFAEKRFLLRGQIIASRSARSSKGIKKCDSTEEPTFPGQDMVLVFKFGTDVLMRWHEQSKRAGRKKTDAKRGLNREHMGVLHARPIRRGHG